MSDQPPPPQPPDPGGNQPPGPGYWMASDGNWYPPQQQPQPSSQMTPTPPQQYAQMPPVPPGGGLPGWAKGCLAAIAVVAVFGILGVACVAILADKSVKSVDRAIKEAASTTTTAGAEAEVTTSPPVEESDATCSYAGIGGYTSKGMQVELTFTNPLGEVNGLEATFALLDGEGGSRFFTDTAGGLDLEDISFPAADERFRLSVDTGDEVPPNINEATIGCTVLAIEEQTDIGGFQRASDADTCTVVGADSSGNIQVELAVTSPYKETTKVQTWWALQAPGPVRFETETEVVDLVGGGESFRINPEYGTEKPEWIGDGGVTCVVVGFWDQGR